MVLIRLSACQTTLIKYCLAYKTKVRLEVFNPEGKMIEILIDEEKEAGTYEVEFSVGQDSRPDIASGIYFYKLQTGSFIENKKMLLLK